MSSIYHFTEQEIAVIDGVIATYYPRMAGEALRRTYRTVHEHLERDSVSLTDLRRIESVLQLSQSGRCADCRREEERELVHVLMKARTLLREPR